MTIPLKDMRITRSEKEERGTAIASAAPEFPYGLTITLGEDEISKLGMDKLPSPGTSGIMMAKVIFESASIRKDKESQNRSLTMQITKMGVSTDTSEMEEEEETVEGNGPPKPTVEQVLFTS